MFAAAMLTASSFAVVSAQTFTPARVAVIRGDAFSDPKTGITRLVKAMTALDVEFKPQKDEIDRLIAQAANLQKELSGLYGNSAADPKTVQAKSDTLDQLKRDITSKSETAQEAYNRRLKVLMEPIQNDIANALEAYAKKRGIDIVIDLSKSDNVYLISETVDITAAFVAEFNAKSTTP